MNIESPRIKVFQKDDFLFKENESGDEMYIILSGRIKILKNVNGRLLALTEAGAGQIIGEMAIIDNAVRSASVKALEETRVSVITRKDFDTNAFNIPEWYAKITRVICKRLRDTNKIIEKNLALPSEINQSSERRDLVIIYMPLDNPRTVKILGFLGSNNYRRLEEVVEELFANKIFNLILDLQGLEDLDNTGISTLFKIAQQIIAQHEKLLIINADKVNAKLRSNFILEKCLDLSSAGFEN